MAVCTREVRLNQRSLALLLLLAGCTERAAPQPAKPAPEASSAKASAQGRDGRWYRATIESPEAEIPFFLFLPPASSTASAIIVNGEERIPIDQLWQGTKGRLMFPVFDSSIDAQIDDAGVLRGDWKMGPLGKAALFHFTAQPIARPDPRLRYAATASPAVDVNGTWRVTAGEFGVGKGTFHQEDNGVVTGTILFDKVGDLRFMAGIVRGRELIMSTFDGQHAYSVRAELGADGKLSGRFVWPTLWSEPITAERAADVSIDFLHHTRLKPGKKRLTLPELDRYAGKAVLVDVFGTWCPACMDMTPFLSELRRKYQDDGLEILGLALEMTDDQPYAEQQVQRFKKRYGVDWDIVILLTEPERAEEVLPPELADIGGLPTTVFVRRDGTVLAVHTGFAGPATGEEHRRVKQRFERLVQQILASKPRGR